MSSSVQPAFTFSGMPNVTLLTMVATHSTFQSHLEPDYSKEPFSFIPSKPLRTMLVFTNGYFSIRQQLIKMQK